MYKEYLHILTSICGKQFYYGCTHHKVFHHSSQFLHAYARKATCIVTITFNSS